MVQRLEGERRSPEHVSVIRADRIRGGAAYIITGRGDIKLIIQQLRRAANSNTVQALFQSADGILDAAPSQIALDNEQRSYLAMAEHEWPIRFIHVQAGAPRFIDNLGVKPKAITGDEIGIFNALVISEVLPFREVIQLVAAYGAAVDSARVSSTGRVAVLSVQTDLTGEDFLSAVKRGWNLELSEAYSKGSIVLGGKFSDIYHFFNTKDYILGTDRLRQDLIIDPSDEKRGAIHTGFMEEPALFLKEILQSVKQLFADPKIPIIDITTGELMKTKEEVYQAVINQITNPVRWDLVDSQLKKSQISSMWEVGSDVFAKIATRAKKHPKTTVAVAGGTAGAVGALVFAHRLWTSRSSKPKGT